MTESTNKKQMRIALVGIAPPDQITLKGYMRVLLRLDVNLEWVAVSDANVDLFMVNNDFRNAESIQKLLEIRKKVPVLYVSGGNDDFEGGLINGILTLPLKQIGLLADWLMANVPVLSGVGMTDGTPRSEPASEPQRTEPAQALTTSSTGTMHGIVDLIQKLQARSKAYFEVVDGSTPVAVIDSFRQVVWVQNANARLSANWQLRPYHGAMSSSIPQDAHQWLWQVGWGNPSVIVGLVDSHSRYQLRYWAKPLVGADRRDLLQIMTAMETEALSITEIAAKATVSATTAKNAVAALLLSGNLTAGAYKDLQVPTAESPSSAQVESPKPEVVEVKNEVATTPPSPEQTEKLGFLARLRKRLGL